MALRTKNPALTGRYGPESWQMRRAPAAERAYQLIDSAIDLVRRGAGFNATQLSGGFCQIRLFHLSEA